ncbi:phage virion morphogenesis protein [Viscerimonas tarda]
MDLEQFEKALPDKLAEIEELLTGEPMKDIVATEAISYFRESFQNEGMDGENWQDVKRRDPSSKWFGHSSEKNAEGKRFSSAATTRSVLTGETGLLGDSFSYQRTENGVKIINNTPYARVHQFGLPAKIYGKKAFQMPARPFMKATPELNRRINEKIVRELKKIV